MTERRVLLAGQQTTVEDTASHRAFWDLVDIQRWEPATLEAINRFADGAVYIDIGAWIGPTVIAAARRAARVIAYEPDPVAVAELRQNVRLNALTNVELRDWALFDRNGLMPLGPGMLDDLGLSVSSLVYSSPAATVVVKDAREEADSEPFMSCSLLKIDVEGAEYRLIGRLAPYLRSQHPTLLLSLHGVQWQNRTFPCSPRFAFPLQRRIGSAMERLLLMWRVRTYQYAYKQAGDCWRLLSRRERWGIVASTGEHDLLLTSDSYD